MWDNLFDPTNNFFDNNANHDHLAWGKGTPGANTLMMRDFELSAIAPDQFDVAYYSVEPDFYRNYYLRLQSGI